MHKTIVVQPEIPKYRLPFFDSVSKIKNIDLEVYYSKGHLGELTKEVNKSWAKKLSHVYTFSNKLYWQSEITKIKLKPNDILILSGNPRYISTLYLFFKAKLCRARVIWWGHYWSSTSKMWTQKLRLLPMYFADGLLFYTDEESLRASKEYLLRNKCNVYALNNGLDISDIKELREEYKAESRPNECLFIGRITNKSKIKELIYAISRIKNDNILLHIIGDGINKFEYQTLAEELGISDKLVWHGAITDEAKIAVIANRCRFFIYAGEVGLSIVHALAYNLPVVVHDNIKKHMPEISAFKNNYNGVQFKYDDVASMAETISQLLNDECKLNRLSLGTHVVGDSYTTDDMSHRFEKLIESVR